MAIWIHDDFLSFFFFFLGIVSTTARPNIVTYASSPTATPSTFSSQSTYKPASSEPLDNELKESVVLRVTGLDVAKVFYL